MNRHKNRHGDPESKRIIKRKIFVTVLLLILMLMPGLVLDILYWKNQYNIVNCSKQIPDYVKFYDNAFQILKSNVGVLMTMVSIFLTMNINIAERSEKKVYGIPRKELYMSKRGQIYQGVVRISYLAPILMIVFLNLSYCISGYFLYIYCYSFLVMHYYIHESSYSKGKTQKAVIAKIKDCCPETEEWNIDIILTLRMLLENIGRSAEQDGNWQEIEDLYNKLIQDIQEDNIIKAYMISYNFYDIVYWKRSNRSRIVPMRLLQSFIKGIDENETEIKNVLKATKWSVLWGMLRVAIYEAEENELIEFFHWFLNCAGRSREVWGQTKRQLPTILFKEQLGMILVLIEYRLRDKGLESNHLKEQIKTIRDYGREVIFDEKYAFAKIIHMINEGTSQDDSDEIDGIIGDLKDDYQKKNRNCMITNIT